MPKIFTKPLAIEGSLCPIIEMKAPIGLSWQVREKCGVRGWQELGTIALAGTNPETTESGSLVILRACRALTQQLPRAAARPDIPWTRLEADIEEGTLGVMTEHYLTALAQAGLSECKSEEDFNVRAQDRGLTQRGAVTYLPPDYAYVGPYATVERVGYDDTVTVVPNSSKSIVVKYAIPE